MHSFLLKKEHMTFFGKIALKANNLQCDIQYLCLTEVAPDVHKFDCLAPGVK